MTNGIKPARKSVVLHQNEGLMEPDSNRHHASIRTSHGMKMPERENSSNGKPKTIKQKMLILLTILKKQ